MENIHLPRGPEELLQYFESVNREYPNDKHWRKGAEMCRHWLSLASAQEVSQPDIDEFLTCYAAEPNASSAWFDLGIQFKHWARTRGFEV